MTTTKTLKYEQSSQLKIQMTGPAVLITGALVAMVRATALAFAREGARIVVSGRHDDKGNALVSELQELALKPRSSNPTFVMMMKFALWLMKR